MADWSYASEELRDIKKYIALQKYTLAAVLTKNIYISQSFADLSREKIKDKNIVNNFLLWLNYVEIQFVEPSYKEEWGEGGARGNKYTLYGDFFTAFVSDEEDILGFMFHEYLHHVQDRVLWTQCKFKKEELTIKERNFIEDMYANSWIRNVAPEISVKWQSFLSNHDMFHGLIFSDEEKSWNSLLTSEPEECNIGINFQYKKINCPTMSLLNDSTFGKFIGTWIGVLKKSEEIKNMLNTMQINNEEWDHEACTPCETEAKKQKEKTNTG